MLFRRAYDFRRLTAVMLSCIIPFTTQCVRISLRVCTIPPPYDLLPSLCPVVPPVFPLAPAPSRRPGPRIPSSSAVYKLAASVPSATLYPLHSVTVLLVLFTLTRTVCLTDRASQLTAVASRHITLSQDRPCLLFPLT
jgi:hypothetical protein